MKSTPPILEAEVTTAKPPLGYRPPPNVDFLGSSIPSSDLTPVHDGPPAPGPEAFKAPPHKSHELSPQCLSAIWAFRREQGKDGEPLSQTRTAKALGIEGGLLSQLLSGSYPANAANMEKKIMAALSVRSLEVRREIVPFQSLVSDRVGRVLKGVIQSRTVTVLVGPQGCGKSASMDYLATLPEWATVRFLRARRHLISSRAQLAAVLRTATGAHPLRRSENLYTDLVERCRKNPTPVVLDQADEARAEAVQFLLSLHAETGAPVLMIGRAAFVTALKSGAYGPLPGGLRWNRLALQDREEKRRAIIDQLAAAVWPPEFRADICRLSYDVPGSDFGALVAHWDAAQRKLVEQRAKGQALDLATAFSDGAVQVLARIGAERLARLAAEVA